MNLQSRDISITGTASLELIIVNKTSIFEGFLLFQKSRIFVEHIQRKYNLNTKFSIQKSKKHSILYNF